MRFRDVDSLRLWQTYANTCLASHDMLLTNPLPCIYGAQELLAGAFAVRFGGERRVIHAYSEVALVAARVKNGATAFPAT